MHIVSVKQMHSAAAPAPSAVLASTLSRAPLSVRARERSALEVSAADMRGSDSAPGRVRRLRTTHTEHVASECAFTAYEAPSPYVSGGITSNHNDLYEAMGIPTSTSYMCLRLGNPRP